MAYGMDPRRGGRSAADHPAFGIGATTGATSAKRFATSRPMGFTNRDGKSAAILPSSRTRVPVGRQIHPPATATAIPANRPQPVVRPVGTGGRPAQMPTGTAVAQRTPPTTTVTDRAGPWTGTPGVMPPQTTRTGGGGVVVNPEFLTSRAPMADQGGTPYGGSRTPITGNERPENINPGYSDRMSQLLQTLTDRAGGGALGDRLQQEAMRQLDQPSAYDDELMQGAIAQGRRELDRYFGGLREGLGEELGSRGMEYSTHGSGRYGDLAAQQGYAMQDLMNNILRERAASIGSERAAAFNNAMGLQGQGFNQALGATSLLGGMERGMRDEARGERGYVDNLRREARGDSIEEIMLGENLRRGREADMARWMGMGMGEGQNTGDLWGGIDTYGGINRDQLGLLEAIAQQYGGM